MRSFLITIFISLMAISQSNAHNSCRDQYWGTSTVINRLNNSKIIWIGLWPTATPYVSVDLIDDTGSLNGSADCLNTVHFDRNNKEMLSLVMSAYATGAPVYVYFETEAQTGTNDLIYLGNTLSTTRMLAIEIGQ